MKKFDEAHSKSDEACTGFKPVANEGATDPPLPCNDEEPADRKLSVN